MELSLMLHQGTLQAAHSRNTQMLDRQQVAKRFAPSLNRNWCPGRCRHVVRAAERQELSSIHPASSKPFQSQSFSDSHASQSGESTFDRSTVEQGTFHTAESPQSTVDRSTSTLNTSYASNQASTSSQPSPNPAIRHSPVTQNSRSEQSTSQHISSEQSTSQHLSSEQSTSQHSRGEESTSQPSSSEQATSQHQSSAESKHSWLKLPWSNGQRIDRPPPDPDVVARQRWSWLLLGVGIFAFGQWVCHRVLTWERYAEFAPGMVLTMKDHTRKQDIWERLLPRYKLKIGFATGDGGLQDPRYAFTTYLTPLNRKLFEKVYYDGHAATLPVLYDSVDPTYCRLDDHNHYNLGKVLMYLGVWVAFINAMKLTLESLSKIQGWGQPGGLVFRDRAGAAPSPIEVVKQAA